MKKIIIMLLIGLAGWGIYHLKNLTGINLIPSYSLSRFYPFKVLDLSRITLLEPGEIFVQEDFDKGRFTLYKAVFLTMSERGRVTQRRAPDGLNASKCLLITSNSGKEWSYLYRTYIRVRQGDAFVFTGFAKVKQGNSHVKFAVSSHDKEKKVIEWEYVISKLSGTGDWQRIDRRFAVGPGISFIRFYITGSGEGEFKFDDIVFQQLE